MGMIYHVCTIETWDQEKDNKKFGKSELKKYGFIHSSTKKGLERIINRFTDETEKYLVLCIDEEPIRDQIRYENKDPDHLFPHFAELIDRDHIKNVMSLKDFLSEE